jgi:alginate O-acetyltransferase complex protein AlgI
MQASRMIIASFSFLAFVFVVIVGYNAHPSLMWRRWVLFVANIIFLSTFSHRLVAFLPLAAFLVFGYFSVRLVARLHSKAAYITIVVGILVIFFWLKKYTFLPNATFLRFTYTTLGLSYIFFRVLHMIIDTHQGSLKDKVSPLSYLNYTLNFTTLVSGPIQDYPDFIEQHLPLVRPPLHLAEMGRGFERIVVGFFKVNVVALVLSMVQHYAINALSLTQPLGTRAWTGAIIVASYPAYLYYNFSGYTDIVIGVAAFLRIVLPENFDRPFATRNFLEFWNHWHMTLSGWLKKYVYTPLVMSLMQRFPSRNAELAIGVMAFFVTFFLIGVWHGQTSEFLFYGVLLGAGVSLNKLYQVLMARRLGKKAYKALANHWLYQSLCRGLNFTFFSFSLLWFWSSWKDLSILKDAIGPLAQMLGWVLIFGGSTIALALWELIRAKVLMFRWRDESFVLSRYFRTVWDTGLVFVLLGVMELLSTPAPDIVYKAF